MDDVLAGTLRNGVYERLDDLEMLIAADHTGRHDATNHQVGATLAAS
jgi:hypothetical protein